MVQFLSELLVNEVCSATSCTGLFCSLFIRFARRTLHSRSSASPLLWKWFVRWQGVNWLGPAVSVCVRAPMCFWSSAQMSAYVYVSMLTAWAVSVRPRTWGSFLGSEHVLRASIAVHLSFLWGPSRGVSSTDMTSQQLPGFYSPHLQLFS